MVKTRLISGQYIGPDQDHDPHMLTAVLVRNVHAGNVRNVWNTLHHVCKVSQMCLYLSMVAVTRWFQLDTVLPTDTNVIQSDQV